MHHGPALIEEIEQTITPTPTLWWIGRSGFILRFATITFYIDPYLSEANALLDPAAIQHADLILASHRGYLDAATLLPMLAASKRSKVVLPKSATEDARASGIPYERMTTTNADLRVEYFKDSLYGRIYAVPSAYPQLDWTSAGGYPYLGYIIRFGRWTVYHAGDCAMYEGLADRLRPFNVSVALLPVGGQNFTAQEAAQLASDIGAKWLIPIGSSEETGFVTHMLGQRPEQPFKVFERGERWTVPED